MAMVIFNMQIIDKVVDNFYASFFWRHSGPIGTKKNWIHSPKNYVKVRISQTLFCPQYSGPSLELGVPRPGHFWMTAHTNCH